MPPTDPLESRPVRPATRFGALPDRPLATWLYGDVAAEIAIEMWTAPELISDRIPSGLKPISLAVAAPADVRSAALLAENARLAGHVSSTLVFGLYRVRLNGRPLSDTGLLAHSFWWAKLANTSRDLPDRRALGQMAPSSWLRGTTTSGPWRACEPLVCPARGQRLRFAA
jgi:hypothetical protein